MLLINQIRKYHEEFTESTIYINGAEFCHCLEDQKQQYGVKVSGYTCIPEGAMEVLISYSNRFQKDMLLLYNQPVDLSVIGRGIKFTGIRPHGGNDTEDTHGCPLLGFEKDGSGKIWKRASDAMFEIVERAIDKEDDVLWVISSREPDL